MIDDADRARFPGLSDAEIQRIHDDFQAADAAKIHFDRVDVTLAKISRLFGYAGLCDFLGEKPRKLEMLRIAAAADYLKLIDEQRRDAAVMISATEPQKRELANKRAQFGREISRNLTNYEMVEL